MTDHDAARRFVQDFCDALKSRDSSRLRPMLAEDVEWTIFGPVDYFPFFGLRSGPDEVIEAMCRQIVDFFQVERCEPERILFDGDEVASLLRISAKHVPSGRVVSFRLAPFFRLRNGQLVEMRAILDSFDAIEQVQALPTYRSPGIAI
jgi:ketosteroid isomerase-like protein